MNNFLQDNKDIYTVSRLNFEVSDLFLKSFSTIWVSGEISNLATPQSGHIYFSLKDEHSQVRCAMFLPQKKSLNFIPENGKQIILQANVTLYEIRGEYQLKVLKMNEAGEGKLQQEFNELKNKLQNQGWFDEKHKKPFVKYPKKVGIITSETGAAIHDILSTFEKRCKAVEILIYPTLVQGELATKNISEMINFANKMQDCDALIVGRGGGSLEDLWAFNQYEIAKAVFDSKIPIVSAVGHESDITIIDFVADFRAATPTAAAVFLTSHWQEFNQKIQNLKRQAQQTISFTLQNKLNQLKILQGNLSNPEHKINQLNMVFDESYFLLNNAINKKVQNYQIELDNLKLNLESKNPQNILLKFKQDFLHLKQILFLNSPNIKENKAKLNLIKQRLFLSQQNQFKQNKSKFFNLKTRLATLSPLNTLSRGYSIVYDENQRIISNVANIKSNQKINIKLAKGSIEALVKKLNNSEK